MGDDIVTLYVPLRTISHSNVRCHWAQRARIRKAERATVHACWLTQRIHLRLRGAPYEVTMTRIAPRELDDDNLAGALKAVRDEVADLLGFDSDRNSEWLEWMPSEQGRSDAGEYAVYIDIRHIEGVRSVQASDKKRRKT